jgi:hypothetical protein
MEEKSALVAQLAERRFRNSSLIPRRRSGDLRPWVQIPSRAFILIILFTKRGETPLYQLSY